MEMGKLELALLVGRESKEWLANLEKQLDRMEKLQGAKAEEEETVTEDETQDDEDFAPAVKKRGRPKKEESFEEEVSTEDEEAPAEEDEELEEEEEPKPAKKAKAPKLTSDDVNAACRARAARSTVAEVKGLLKKQFKVKSISELDPSQYEAVIKAMK